MKLLVRATNWIGDAVLAIPALEAIARKWPGCEIVVLARLSVADLYRRQHWASRFIVYDNKGKHRGLSGKEKLAAELRRERFDTALLLQNAFDAAWIAWRANIPERIGYARDGRSWLLTRAIPVPAEGEIPAHESYYYLELLRRAGWLAEMPALERIILHVPEDEIESAGSKLEAAGARAGTMRIAIGAGAAYGSAKCWDPERYAALADGLISAYGADVILFGAPAEREMADRITRAMRSKAVNLVGATQTSELPALMAACQLFIGNDSGAMHVAGAVGLPVVGIFGPTDERGTRPKTPKFTLVRHEVSCSPCFLRHCPVDHRCMTRISVEEAFGAAKAWCNGAARDEEAISRSSD
jgi:heptosyltransferase-2